MNLPLRTPLTDERGQLTRPWVLYLQGVQSSSTTGIALFVNGTLGIQSDAAPTPYPAAAARVATLRAYLKQPPDGADLKFVINAGEDDWDAVKISDGSTSVTVANPGTISEAKPVRINITAVGTTYPGSDLSVFLDLS